MKIENVIKSKNAKPRKIMNFLFIFIIIISCYFKFKKF
jgi:hypothetical protein